MKDRAGRVANVEAIPGEVILAGVLRSSNHFRRRSITMSEQWGMNGAACLVADQS